LSPQEAEGEYPHRASNLAMKRRYANLLGALQRYLSIILVLFGLGLLSYVGGQYWSMYRSQKELAAEWKQQLVAPELSQSQEPAKVADALTRVSIPKIGLDAIVVEGVSSRQLAIGPGHLADTPLPGEDGNSVITAHRDTFFRHIYELAKGDDIQVRRAGDLFTYRVTGKKVVKPQDISVLKQTTDPQLTLITCYPTYYIGPAPERLVIFSKLVERRREAQSRGQEPTQVEGASN